MFTGGAHGLTNTTQMVFDLRNGELINESDIFYAESMDALTNCKEVLLFIYGSYEIGILNYALKNNGILSTLL